MTKKISTKWTLEFSDLVKKDFKALDKGIQKEILKYLYQNLETEESPKRFGKPLTGNLKNLWRYRVRDYRAICEIREDSFCVMVVRVAHRREIYKLHLVYSAS